jgi:hypothetical protein
MTIGTAALTALLLSGCKKPLPPDEPAPAATNAVTAVETNVAPVATNPPPVIKSRGKDLGAVQLTNRCETRIEVGDGKSCTIKPLLRDPQHLQLTMTLESKLDDGKTRGLKIMSVIAKPDVPFEVNFGSLVFMITPQLVTPPAPAP